MIYFLSIVFEACSSDANSYQINCFLLDVHPLDHHPVLSVLVKNIEFTHKLLLDGMLNLTRGQRRFTLTCSLGIGYDSDCLSIKRNRGV